MVGLLALFGSLRRKTTTVCAEYDDYVSKGSAPTD